HMRPIVCETRDSIKRGSSPTVREGSRIVIQALPDGRATAPLDAVSSSTSSWLPDDKVLSPICSTVAQLSEVIDKVLQFAAADADINADVWERGRYCPTPTIIEAA